MPKQLDKAELNAIGLNACKERRGKVVEHPDEAEFNAVSYSANVQKVLVFAETKFEAPNKTMDNSEGVKDGMSNF